MKVIETILKGMVLIGLYIVYITLSLFYGIIIVVVDIWYFMYRTSVDLIWDLKNIGR